MKGESMYGYTIFHEDIMNSLIRSVHEGRSANAYIFEGSKGLGVGNAAELFAKALTCLNEPNAPCGSCGPCAEISSGANPDLIRITKPKDKASIGIDISREMISAALTKPLYSRRKVILIEDGELLTAEAQNALLKVLEEPPEYAVFITVCESADNILETVRSRSVTIEFPPVGDDIVEKYITEKYPDDPRVDFLVKYCSGVPLTADTIIESGDLETLRTDALTLVKQLLSSNKLDAFRFSEYFDSHKENAASVCDIILLYLRDIIVTQLCGGGVTNIDKTDDIRLLAASSTAPQIMAAADEIVVMKKMLGRFVKASAAAMHAVLGTSK